MASSTTSTTTARGLYYRPALAWFATLGSAWVFVLVVLGAFTTSINAGMAFADWPLSNGSLNPTGWLSNIAMFAEHSHRLSGGTMGLITIGLAVWLWRTEPRAWVRKLGWSALGIVILQGIIGGQRVRLDGWHVPGFEMSVGQFLKIPHGILAQLFVIVLLAIASSVSRPWIQAPSSTFSVDAGTRKLGILCTTLIFVQLVIAATMRHLHAGLAIPTFPLTPEGGLLPARWNFYVGIHFAHRAMALALGIALIWYGVRFWRLRSASLLLKNTAALMMALLVMQISLGAAVIWTLRDPYFTTAHVLVGASTFAVTFLLTWFSHRNSLEGLSEEQRFPSSSTESRHAPGIASSRSSAASS